MLGALKVSSGRAFSWITQEWSKLRELVTGRFVNGSSAEKIPVGIKHHALRSPQQDCKNCVDNLPEPKRCGNLAKPLVSLWLKRCFWF